MKFQALEGLKFQNKQTQKQMIQTKMLLSMLLNLCSFDLINTWIREFVNLWTCNPVNLWICVPQYQIHTRFVNLGFYGFRNSGKKYQIQAEQPSWMIVFVISWIRDFMKLYIMQENLHIFSCRWSTSHTHNTKYKLNNFNASR